MTKYDTTPAAAYRQMNEESPAAEGRRAAMNDYEREMQYDGLDMEAMKAMFLEELTEEIIEILREFASEDRTAFNDNKEDLFRSIEGLLRQPTLRDLDARTLVRREDPMNVA